MEKKARLCGSDRISGLPEEILVVILSRLTIKDAAATSVLSRRWVGLWRYFIGSLDFGAPHVGDRFVRSLDFGAPYEVGDRFVRGSPESGESRYVHWVNQVLLNLHNIPSLDAFRVTFRLDKTFSQVLDSWIDLASKKGVGLLQLDLGGIDAKSRYGNLTSLFLSSVDVSDQHLSDFLANCPTLQLLGLRCSNSLVDVKIISHSKLTNLEISNCPNLKHIRISGMKNLVFFKYIGRRTNMFLENVPFLSQIQMGGRYCYRLVSDFRGLVLVHPSQLHKIVLDLSDMDPRLVVLVFRRGFPEFTNLKYLEVRLQLEVWDKHSILFLTNLIDACPCLQRFRLKVATFGMCLDRHLHEQGRSISRREPINRADMKYLDPNLNFYEPSDRNSRVHYKIAPISTLNSRTVYKRLKVVDLGGFSGHPSELQLAMYFLENAPLLKRMTINPCSKKIHRIFLDLEKMQVAREHAKQLETKLPSGAKLSIL